MAKSINWPAQYRETILSEDTETVFSAVRLGRLYYDNQYWSPEERVLIRSNHKVIRGAVVVGELWCGPMAEMSPEHLAGLKTNLQTVPQLLDFLRKTYEQPEITPETEVTVVSYRNLPVDPELLEKEDDPHM